MGARIRFALMSTALLTHDEMCHGLGVGVGVRALPRTLKHRELPLIHALGVLNTHSTCNCKVFI